MLVAGCLLVLSTVYSSTHWLQAAGLWAGLAVAGTWLPQRLPKWANAVLRCVLCLAPLAAVVAHAYGEYAETQRKQQEEIESNPYLRFK
jgi:hypothetical protein